MSERAPLPWAGWAVLGALGVLLFWFGFDRGPDVLVDFGRELYVPWRLVEGDALHRDIAWFNGPLAPWILEGWMRLFGVSLDSVQALNGLVIAVTTVLMVLLVERFGGRLAALASGGVFLSVFAVAQQEKNGNFQFLSPYSHGITIGFATALAALWCLLQALERQGERRGVLWAGAGGAFCSLTFLTKAEVSLALGAAGALLLLSSLRSSASLRWKAQAYGAFVALGSVVVGLAYLRFSRQLPEGGAWKAVLGTWPHLLLDGARDLPFYRAMRGTADVPGSLGRMGTWTLGIALYWGAVLVLAGRARRALEPMGRAGVPLVFAVVFGATGALFMVVPIKWLLLPLTPLLLGWTVLSMARWIRASDEEAALRAAAELAWMTFGLVLLLKVFLAPISRQYGFVLAIPGTMALVVLTVQRLPRVPAQVAASLAILAVFCSASVYATAQLFGDKKVPIGHGADRFMADEVRGKDVSDLLQDLEGRLGPDDTLLVLPEGVMLNYQLRRVTPTRVVNFMPPELIFFSEEAILEELEDRRPEVVVLTHRPTDIYGYPFFGEGYGEKILAWVREHYQKRRQMGDDPFLKGKSGAFGASILTPKD